MSKDFQNVLKIVMNMIWDIMHYPVLTLKAISFTEGDLKIISYGLGN